MEEMIGRIKQRFVIFTVAEVVLFGAVALARALGAGVSIPRPGLGYWGLALMTVAATFGVALPILLRTTFFGSAAKRGGATLPSYETLQQRQIYLVGVGVLAACLAYLFGVPEFHLGAAVLAALYGVYSVLPSAKKLRGEIKFLGME